MVIITCPRIPEQEFHFQKKVTTEDGRLKISTEVYEDVNQLIRRCNVIMEFTRLARQIADIYTKGTELPYRNTTGLLTYFDTFNHQKVQIS